jgi:hypothetical protein
MTKRRNYNTTYRTDLLKEIKLLAVELGKKENEIIEEGMMLVLEKYGKGDKIRDGRNGEDS